MGKDKDDYVKPEPMPQYAHLKSYELAMPVIRKLLGVSEHGRMPDNFIGRTMQIFIDANREKTLREGIIIEHETLE